MIWRRLFPCRPEQARHVRAFVRTMMQDLPLIDDAVAVVSELVNVAVTRNEGRPYFTSFIVEVQRYGRHGEHSRVTVYDCGPTGIPTFRERHNTAQDEPVPDTTDGLALLILHGLADAVGYWDGPHGTPTYPMRAEFPDHRLLDGGP
nr:ATP-binding protein [Sinosporangium siamense]